VTATPAAAGAAVGEEAGGQYEQTGLRVGIAGLPGGERRGVGVEDRGAAWVIKG